MPAGSYTSLSTKNKKIGTERVQSWEKGEDFSWFNWITEWIIQIVTGYYVNKWRKMVFFLLLGKQIFLKDHLASGRYTLILQGGGPSVKIMSIRGKILKFSGRLFFKEYLCLWYTIEKQLGACTTCTYKLPVDKVVHLLSISVLFYKAWLQMPAYLHYPITKFTLWSNWLIISLQSSIWHIVTPWLWISLLKSATCWLHIYSFCQSFLLFLQINRTSNNDQYEYMNK